MVISEGTVLANARKVSLEFKNFICYTHIVSPCLANFYSDFSLVSAAE